MTNANPTNAASNRPVKAALVVCNVFLLVVLFAVAVCEDIPAQPVVGVGDRRTNSLGQVFVPVEGTSALFCIWDTRVQDYKVFALETVRQWPKPDFPQEPTHPAVNVSWQDARAFCEWLTQKEHTLGMLKANLRYRLPTDAEWSLAAGLTNEPSGTPADKNHKVTGIYPWGRGWPPAKGSGNFADETLSAKKKDAYKVIEGYNDGYAETSPVGAFAANRFGLFDMGGNVWQWCDDWYDPAQHDRVLRGGSCVCIPRMLLLSWRNHFAPAQVYSYIGFRCVLAGAP